MNLRSSSFRVAVLFLALTFGSALAGERRVGDWASSTDDPERISAYTMNGAGSILSMSCPYTDGSRACFYAFSLQLGCVEDSRYPVLVNTDVGASHEMIICSGRTLDDGSTLYFFASYESINDTIRAASRIGIVFPAKGDQFEVLRFSLSGSRQCLEAVDYAVRQANENYRPARESL